MQSNQKRQATRALVDQALTLLNAEVEFSPGLEPFIVLINHLNDENEVLTTGVNNLNAHVDDLTTEIDELKSEVVHLLRYNEIFMDENDKFKADIETLEVKMAATTLAA